MKNRITIILLSMFILLACAMSTFATEPQGYFVLTVCTVNSVIVPPEKIYYTEGQTVKDALLSSGHEFEGLAERNYIDSIDGEVANYTFFYDAGGYRMDTPASEITAMRFGVTTVPQANQEAMLTMLKTMAEYTSMKNNVQNYPDAQKAYKACLNAARGDGSDAEDKETALTAAIAAYENILNGTLYTVTATANQNGTVVANPVITMTDSYGNITTAQGNSIRVVSGDYTFSVSDGGFNRTEGTIKVRNNTSFSVDLPSGEWFGEMYMRSYFWKTGYDTPYRSEQNSSTHKTTIWVDDIAEGYYGTNLVVYIGDVPDVETTRLKTIFVSVDGRDFSETVRNWAKPGASTAYGNFLDSLVLSGMEGRTFSIEAWYPLENGFNQIQSYEIELIRIPTLAEISIKAEETKLPLEFDTNTWDYDVSMAAETLNIMASPFSDSYTVSGTGVVPVDMGDSIKTVTVTAENGMSSEYHLHITRYDTAEVTLNVPLGTEVSVYNVAGAEIIPVNGKYHMIPGCEYLYITTKDEYYHTRSAFIASDKLSVDVADPITDDWLEDIGVYYGSYGLNWLYIEVDKPFSSANHYYTYHRSDCNAAVYMQATASFGKTYAYHERKESVFGEEEEFACTVGSEPNSGGGLFRPSGVYFFSGDERKVTIRVKNTEDNVDYYQDYVLAFDPILHIKELIPFDDNSELTFLDESGNAVEFDRDVIKYSVQINREEEEIFFMGQFPYEGENDNNNTRSYVLVNGIRFNYIGYNGTGRIIVPLDPGLDEETVIIEVCHDNPKAIHTTYTIHVQKTQPVAVAVDAQPSDLVMFLTNDLNGKRVEAESGIYWLTPGNTYSYNATHAGYVGTQGQYTVPEAGGVLSVHLETADVNAGLVQMNAQWPHLRIDNTNNAVIHSPTPIDAETTMLYWATDIGEGYDSGACSPPIMVDGYLYVYSGQNIFKVDANTGTVVTTAPMEKKSSFAINPPTYAEGMIFVGLANGTVQAFNASTLESLWVYHDPIGGQPNSSIVYHDGYIYTGFWRGEDKEANYVCLSVTDEQPGQTTEEKLATWRYTCLGGFYWSGAYVCDSFVLVGTDDGESGYTKGSGKLVTMETKTGHVISEVTMTVVGDIRSSITQYAGKFYFTCKGGYFFEASVNTSGEIGPLRTLKLDNGGTASNPPMSTSTPVIYNGRAYIGVSGIGQFNAYSGHNITVIDINNWEIAYSVPTRGYPQTSGVVTTAYEQESGYAYVYLLDNYTPGILRLLKDKPGLTEAALTTKEYGIDTALNLFSPIGEHAEYCICSPIVDSNGTLYFKNDSGCLFAIGSTIEELEVIQEPEKTTYKEGEKFDSTGLRVVAHFANGTQRDVTDYLTWSAEPLSTEDKDFQVEYPIVLYQNVSQEDGTMLVGVDVTPPIATLLLTIEEEESIKYGDVTEDGKINMWDYREVILYCNDEVGLTDAQFRAADVDGNGKVNMWDYRNIILYCNDEISRFPVEQYNSP